MEIQWMVIARATRINSDGTLDIAGVFDGVTMEGPPFRVPMLALAKVRFDPQYAGEKTVFTLRIDRNKVGHQLEVDMPYVYPTLAEWVHGARAFIQIDLTEVEFAEAGEYEISILHDGRMIASEFFTIRAT